MQGLTIDQLKLARDIGATDVGVSYRYSGLLFIGLYCMWSNSEWIQPNDVTIDDIELIDFSPLDEYLGNESQMKERDQTEWPDEDNPRQQAIEQNGNDGEVYKEPERMTGGYRDVGKSESTGMKDKYPKYYKDVSGLNEIDVYQIHNLFDVQDASGCLQHASKKLLLSGVRTGGKSKHDDIREARDTLTRWLDIN